MKKALTFACATSLLLTLALNALADNSAGIFVPPEKTTSVVVSNRDVNRINCPGPIQEVFWSVEKPIAVNYEGNNAFVKFKVRIEGDRNTYVREPADIHVVCRGQVYTMILLPREGNATTVRLGDKTVQAIKETLDTWGALALEEQVQKLTLAMYRDDIPNGFTKEEIHENKSFIRTPVPAVHAAKNKEGQPINLQAVARYRVHAKGLGLIATEYSVYSQHDAYLHEKNFLHPAFGDRIVAITVDPIKVNAYRHARVFIIERSEGYGDL